MSKKRKHPGALTKPLSEPSSSDESSFSSSKSDSQSDSLQSGLSQSDPLQSNASHLEASQLESLQSDSSQSDWLQSDSSQSDASHLEAPQPKRRFNVYDAVAGRVTQAGRIENTNNSKDSKRILRPGEVLFKKAGAPIRYEETDYYHAHARLPVNQQLPSGDLLSAIHAYVSELYSRTKPSGYEDDGDSTDEDDGKSIEVDEGNSTDEARWECMDETALIAMGILMEETARGVLGETGDLAFTEDADDNDDEGEEEDGEEEEEYSEEEEVKDNDTTRSAAQTAKTGAVRSLSWSSSGDDSSFSPEDSA